MSFRSRPVRGGTDIRGPTRRTRRRRSRCRRVSRRRPGRGRRGRCGRRRPGAGRAPQRRRPGWTGRFRESCGHSDRGDVEPAPEAEVVGVRELSGQAVQDEARDAAHDGADPAAVVVGENLQVLEQFVDDRAGREDQRVGSEPGVVAVGRGVEHSGSNARRWVAWSRIQTRQSTSPPGSSGPVSPGAVCHQARSPSSASGASGLPAALRPAATTRSSNPTWQETICQSARRSVSSKTSSMRSCAARSATSHQGRVEEEQDQRTL